jgi:3-methyl-2-oxobutanoate hydroxymethyltransferase
MLGLIEDFKPRFVRRYANLAVDTKDAFKRYMKDVKDGKFPTDEESY